MRCAAVSCPALVRTSPARSRGRCIRFSCLLKSCLRLSVRKVNQTVFVHATSKCYLGTVGGGGGGAAADWSNRVRAPGGNISGRVLSPAPARQASVTSGNWSPEEFLRGGDGGEAGCALSAV